MKLTIEFTCDRCGLLTPGIVELPDDVDVRRLARLEHQCFHCEATLCIEAKVCDLLGKE